MTNKERQRLNEEIFFEKHYQYSCELKNKLDENGILIMQKLGNAELTEEELKLMAKKEFIKELSRQLTNLL